MHNRVLFLSKNKDIHASFRSGVSLHGHTKHSLESLGFLGKIIQRQRLLRSWIAHQARECRRRSGINLDFDRAYWTPPLTAQLAYELEARQIESIGLRPMVSLSDHNNIEAATLLRLVPEQEGLPISVEWTVPFGNAVFHLGVHNMPHVMAHDLMSTLSESTANADDRQITNLISELQCIPSLLLVFNHPVWNFNGVAQDVFDFELKRFLQCVAGSLHAFELNGMRSHRENQRVTKLAAEWNQIVVSGGDRHGCEPNAFLNLTNATEFPEFVDEIRTKQLSTILTMPQYNEPIGWRFFQGFLDVIREYPEHPQGQRKWDERIFHPDISGEVVPLNTLWPNGSPGFLKKIFALAVMVSSAPVHWAVHTLMSMEQSGSLTLPHAFGTSQIDLDGEQLVGPNKDQLLI